jgi:hypothetical protein
VNLIRVGWLHQMMHESCFPAPLKIVRLSIPTKRYQNSFPGLGHLLKSLRQLQPIRLRLAQVKQRNMRSE